VYEPAGAAERYYERDERGLCREATGATDLALSRLRELDLGRLERRVE